MYKTLYYIEVPIKDWVRGVNLQRESLEGRKLLPLGPAQRAEQGWDPRTSHKVTHTTARPSRNATPTAIRIKIYVSVRCGAIQHMCFIDSVQIPTVDKIVAGRWKTREDGTGKIDSQIRL